MIASCLKASSSDGLLLIRESLILACTYKEEVDPKTKNIRRVPCNWLNDSEAKRDPCAAGLLSVFASAYDRRFEGDEDPDGPVVFTIRKLHAQLLEIFSVEQICLSLELLRVLDYVKSLGSVLDGKERHYHFVLNVRKINLWIDADHGCAILEDDFSSDNPSSIMKEVSL